MTNRIPSRVPLKLEKHLVKSIADSPRIMHKPEVLNMGAEGLEPSRPYSQQILSLLRLPFRHAPSNSGLPDQ